MWETWIESLGQEDPLEKAKATHSSILAWKIPWTLWLMRLQRVGHYWVTFTSLHFPIDIFLIGLCLFFYVFFFLLFVFCSLLCVFFAYKNVFSNYCKVGLMVINSLSFCLSVEKNSPGLNTGVGSLCFLQERFWYLHWISMRPLLGRVFLVVVFSLSSLLNISCHWLLACRVSTKK